MAAISPELRPIFCEALELGSEEERCAYLDRACQGDADLRARIDALLLAHHDLGEFLEQPVPPPSVTWDAPGPFEAPGAIIGPYKLMEQIGEGGCGVVFMAEQEQPVRRKVALKVIKLGMDTRQVVARFEAERQALALMDHPNIARGAGCRHHRVGPAVLRHGTGARHPDHRILRPEPDSTARAAGAVRPKFATPSSTRIRRASFTATSSLRTCWSPRTTASRCRR